MSEVLAAIVHRLSEEYSKIELKSDYAKKRYAIFSHWSAYTDDHFRMTQDVALISSRLASLSESGKTVTSLETLVKDKTTPRRPMGQAMAGLMRRATSGASSKKAEIPIENGVKGVNGDEEGVAMVEEPVEIEELRDSGEVERPNGMAPMIRIDSEGLASVVPNGNSYGKRVESEPAPTEISDSAVDEEARALDGESQPLDAEPAPIGTEPLPSEAPARSLDAEGRPLDAEPKQPGIGMEEDLAASPDAPAPPKENGLESSIPDEEGS